MEYKNMNDSELAKVMVDFINRTEKLKDNIAQHIDRQLDTNVPLESIKNDYTQLKKELREAAKYLRLQRNKQGSLLYEGFFMPSIIEADAEGFMAPINHPVDFEMFSAVSTAHYKLTKYKEVKEWERVI